MLCAQLFLFVCQCRHVVPFSHLRIVRALSCPDRLVLQESRERCGGNSRRFARAAVTPADRWGPRNDVHSIMNRRGPAGRGRRAGLVARLRAGDEAAFAELVRRTSAPAAPRRGDRVGSRAVAEEVVQDTWLAVVRGVDRFEGRSSFKTWLFRILVNRARSTRRPRAARRPLADDAVGERFDAAGRVGEPPAPWADAGRRPARRRALAARVHDAPRRAAGRATPGRRSCATSKDWPPPRSRRCSASPTATSGCCCTGAGPASASTARRRRWERREACCSGAAPSDRLPPGRRADGRLPRRRALGRATAPPRGPPGRLPALLRVPRPAPGHDRRARPGRTRRRSPTRRSTSSSACIRRWRPQD